MHVVSHRFPAGDNFKVLGVEWDPKLLMHDAAETLVQETRWKVVQLLRSRRYFTVGQLLVTSAVPRKRVCAGAARQTSGAGA